MDLFGLIVEYLYQYIFDPLFSAINNNLSFGNALDGNFVFFKGQFYFYQRLVDENGSQITDLPFYDDNGNLLFGVTPFNVEDFLVFLTTIVIFILLFIVAVKFIVWLFKQISFVTRF